MTLKRAQNQSGLEHLAKRRGRLREASRWLVVPTGLVCRPVALLPLRLLLRELNTSHVYPPGLRATVNHLLIRAAGRSLKRFPEFNDFYLQSGRVMRNPEISVRIPFEVEDHANFSVVENPGGRPFSEVVISASARQVEDTIAATQHAEKLVRFHREHFLLSRLLFEGILTPLYFAKCYSKRVQRWMGTLTKRSTATFTLANVGKTKASSFSAPLLGFAVGGVLVSAPSLDFCMTGGEPRSRESISIGVQFDLRFFEAFEAAEFLDDMVQQLADPQGLAQGED